MQRLYNQSHAKSIEMATEWPSLRYGNGVTLIITRRNIQIPNMSNRCVFQEVFNNEKQ